MKIFNKKDKGLPFNLDFFENLQKDHSYTIQNKKLYFEYDKKSISRVPFNKPPHFNEQQVTYVLYIHCQKIFNSFSYPKKINRSAFFADFHAFKTRFRGPKAKYFFETLQKEFYKKKIFIYVPKKFIEKLNKNEKGLTYNKENLKDYLKLIQKESFIKTAPIRYGNTNYFIGSVFYISVIPFNNYNKSNPSNASRISKNNRIISENTKKIQDILNKTILNPTSKQAIFEKVKPCLMSLEMSKELTENLISQLNSPDLLSKTKIKKATFEKVFNSDNKKSKDYFLNRLESGSAPYISGNIRLFYIYKSLKSNKKYWQYKSEIVGFLNLLEENPILKNTYSYFARLKNKAKNNMKNAIQFLKKTGIIFVKKINGSGILVRYNKSYFSFLKQREAKRAIEKKSFFQSINKIKSKIRESKIIKKSSEFLKNLQIDLINLIKEGFERFKISLFKKPQYAYAGASILENSIQFNNRILNYEKELQLQRSERLGMYNQKQEEEMQLFTSNWNGSVLSKSNEKISEPVKSLNTERKVFNARFLNKTLLLSLVKEEEGHLIAMTAEKLSAEHLIYYYRNLKESLIEIAKENEWKKYIIKKASILIKGGSRVHLELLKYEQYKK